MATPSRGQTPQSSQKRSRSVAKVPRGEWEADRILPCDGCGKMAPVSVSPKRWHQITSGEDSFICKGCIHKAEVSGMYELDYIVERREKTVYEYLIKWKGFDNAHSTWEPEDSLVWCEEEKRKFDEEQDTQGNQQRSKKPKSKRQEFIENKVNGHEWWDRYEYDVRAKLGSVHFKEMTKAMNDAVEPLDVSPRRKRAYGLVFMQQYVTLFNRAEEEDEHAEDEEEDGE